MEEGSINFKALRAKFQEEALLSQSKAGRPAVAEKPKHHPPPGGHCSIVVSSINIAVENKTPVVPRVIFRDELRASGGKRPISFPPQLQQTSPSNQLGNGESTTRQSLIDRHMPLVLPIQPVKEQKSEPPAMKEHKVEPKPGLNIMPQTRIKKKGLLLPFKSSKASKVSAENGEEPTYTDLTSRPSSAPGELPSMDKQPTEDGVPVQSDKSTAELPLSSPDIPNTPPPAETVVDSDNKIISTLERAKKKFSRRQILISAKPKILRSPDNVMRDEAFPSPPKKIESADLEQPVLSPVFLPHLACISARPFFKANNSVHKLDKQFIKDKAEPPSVKPGPSPYTPPKKTLPALKSLGPMPPKPPRPPLVDFSCYELPTVNEVSSGLHQVQSEEPESEHTLSVLAAPEFPDFDHSEMETAESEAVDVGALDLEDLDLVSPDLPVPDECELSGFWEPLPALSSCDPIEPLMSTEVRDLNLSSQSIIPFDPDSLPEPINISEFPEPPTSEQWSQSEEVNVDPHFKSQADEADLGAASTQDADNSDEPAPDDEVLLQQSGCKQDSYHEAADNVYEDIESVNKLLTGQHSRKRKVGLKNPYTDIHPVKEGTCHNIWHRNPRGNVAGEHFHMAHIHVLSKECQSPNTAEYKEQKKREKQRLEKERKEQREREKKENEMKKKFKVTGEEEPMYHARVMVASKVRKNDLPVKTGDTVSIIRTTSCPKGKWLARDANNKYGYISVMNVELNIKEMLELGKKAQAAGRGGNQEGDTISIGSRSSSHPVLTSSFTDDSEEWACEDETLSLSNESHSFPQQTASIPEMSCGHDSAQHTLSDAKLEDLHTQTRHEALQKLAIFFQHSKDGFGDIPDSGGATPTNADPPNFLCAVEEPPYPEQEVDFKELEIFPPPPLYADTF